MQLRDIHAARLPSILEVADRGLERRRGEAGGSRMDDGILRWQFFCRHPGHRPSVESHRQGDAAHTLARGAATPDFLPASDACRSSVRCLLLPWRERPRSIGRWRWVRDHHGDASSSGLEQFIEGVTRVLDEMEAIGDLDRRRRRLSCSLSIRFRAIPHDDLDAWMVS